MFIYLFLSPVSVHLCYRYIYISFFLSFFLSPVSVNEYIYIFWRGGGGGGGGGGGEGGGGRGVVGCGNVPVKNNANGIFFLKTICINQYVNYSNPECMGV